MKGDGPRAPGRLALVGATALVLAIGLALGRWSAGDAERAAPETRTPAPSAPVATRPATPRDARERSRPGAVTAATSAMTALARPDLLLEPTRRRAVIAQVAAPGYRAELGALFDRGYDHIARELGESDPSRILVRLVPLGHRVESFSRSHARVAVWQVLLLGAAEGRVVASWSTSRAELVWMDGRWAVARFSSDEPGPGPSVTNAATATPPEVFLARVADLEPLSR